MHPVRSVFSLAPALVLPVLLAACTAAPPQQDMTTAKTKAAAEPPPSSTEGKPPETPGAETPGADTARATPPPRQQAALPSGSSESVTQPAPPVAKTLPALMGLADARIVALLGKPDLQWPEGRVAIWQYDGGRCVLRLYMAERNGSRRLSYMQAHWPDRGSGSPRQCAEILFARKNNTADR